MTDLDLEKAERYLFEMGDLLESSGHALSWARRLKALAGKKTMHPDDFRSQIKGLFGGMGSLNDLVICDSQGKLDRDLNIKFDDLRHKLRSVI